MEKKTIQLNESGLNLRDGSNMIFKIIDNQINNYKLQFQTEWEKDHTISPFQKNNKVDKLESLRKELLDVIKDLDAEEGEVNFSLYLDVEINNKAHSKMKYGDLAAS